MMTIGKSQQTIQEHLQDMLNDRECLGEMTGYQIIAVKQVIGLLNGTSYERLMELAKTVPDPETGLVPCGCGGNPFVKRGENMYSGYYAMCQNCECNLGYERDEFDRSYGRYAEKEQAIEAWNRAMGYREETT